MLISVDLKMEQNFIPTSNRYEWNKRYEWNNQKRQKVKLKTKMQVSS